MNAQQIVINLLALFLLLIGPVWDYFDTRGLKSNPSSRARLRYYLQTIVWLWIAAIAACWGNGFGALFTLHGLGISGLWLHLHRWAWWLLAVLIGLFVLLQPVLPVVQVLIKHRNRPYIEPRALQQLRFFLPSSSLERRWFAALCVTAGICEELLFRGFLLRYLHTSPLRLGLAWTILISAAGFGAHHLYQGFKGAVSAGAGALIFTAILLVTGNLLAGILLHAATDLSILLYWRPKPVDLDR